MTRLRSNSAGSGGAGSGEDRSTALTIDCRTASSPLQLAIDAPTTSPPGICCTLTVQRSPGRALAGRIAAGDVAADRRAADGHGAGVVPQSAALAGSTVAADGAADDQDVAAIGDVQPAAIARRGADSGGHVIVKRDAGERDAEAGAREVLNPAAGPVGRVARDRRADERERAAHGVEDPAAAAKVAVGNVVGRVAAADRLSAVKNATAGRTIKAEHGAERRRLAGAIGAEQRHPFTFSDREADVPQRPKLAVVDDEM